MTRPSSSFVPPEYFESGEIGRQTATFDEPFMHEQEDVLRIVLDNFINMLPEWNRSSVQMTLMSKMTYEEAANVITTLRGIHTDKKTVWRWTYKGVEMIQEWLSKAPWVNNITGGKIPVDKIDLTSSIKIPGFDDGSD